MQRLDDADPPSRFGIARRREFFARHRVLGWLFSFAVTFLGLFGIASVLGRDDALRFAIAFTLAGLAGQWLSSWLWGADDHTRRGGSPT